MEKEDCSTLYDLIIIIECTQDQCICSGAHTSLLVPVSHRSFISVCAKQDNEYQNNSVNFPHSTRRQKQQPFLPMNNLVSLSYGGCIIRHCAVQHKHTQPFCHNPCGSDKVQTSYRKKKHVTQTVFNLHKKCSNKTGEDAKETKRASSPCDYSLKLGIIRSQTRFTPCSSLIVLKSSVTRRRRRMPASKHTYMCRRKRAHKCTQQD